MGIPKFASWITKKYPDIVVKVAPARVHGLYIDMNGIIHPCCHSEDDPSVSTRSTEEKMLQVCLCVEQLVEVTRPTTVLYLAMDGVAPRAKMNQQRARRYMAAASKYGAMFAPAEHGFTKSQRQEAKKDLQEAHASLDLGSGLYSADHHDISKTAAAATAVDSNNNGMMGPSQGSEDFLSRMLPAEASFEILDELQGSPPQHGKLRARDAQPHRREDIDHDEAFDSNCISPGTVFMSRMSDVLRAFVEEKLRDAPADSPWHNLCVVLSDSNSPGEGEHKLIDFLRSQSAAGSNAGSLFHRGTPGGGGAHVICGLDADLILLCLSLHLPDVWIMRDVKRQSNFKKKEPPSKSQQGSKKKGGEEEDEDGDNNDDDTAAADYDNDGEADNNNKNNKRKPQNNSSNSSKSKPSNNDAATPPPSRYPTYEYFQIDTIGNSIVSEVYALTQVTGFQDRSDLKAPIISGAYRFFSYSKDGTLYPPQSIPPRFKPSNPCQESYNSKIIDDFVCLASIMGNDFLPRVPSAFCGESAMDNILEVYTRRVLPYGFVTGGGHELDLKQLCRFFEGYSEIETLLFRQQAIKSNVMDPKDAGGPVGSVVDQQTWRKQYYDTTTCTREKLETGCRAYVEGLRFVWRYYSATSEMCSWSWGYPLHHAPFCSDIAAYLKQYQCDPKQIPAPLLERDPPSPFTQLLCILPPTSGPLVPKCLEDVMWSPPEALQTTFPLEWGIDYSGADEKEHLATVLLPLANLDKLREVVQRHAAAYSEVEQVRNTNRARHDVLMRRDVREHKWKNSTEMLFGLTNNEARGGAIWAGSFVDVAPVPVRPKTYSPSLPIRGFVLGSAEDSLYVTARSMVTRKRNNNNTNTTSSTGKRANSAATAAASGGTSQRARGPSLGEFYVACLAFALVAMLFGLFPFTAGGVSNSIVGWSGLVEAMTLLLTHPAWFYGTTGVLTLAVIGTLTNAPLPSGANLHRNPIRDAHVDWMCPSCFQLNFMRNERCFLCHSPFEIEKASAVFTGKLPHQPPLFDPNHASYVQLTELKLAKESGHQQEDEGDDEIDMM